MKDLESILRNKGVTYLASAESEAPLSGPIGIVRDVPASTWHPSMGIPREITADEFWEDAVTETKESDPPPWFFKLGAAITGLCVMALMVGATVKFLLWMF